MTRSGKTFANKKVWCAQMSNLKKRGYRVKRRRHMHYPVHTRTYKGVIADPDVSDPPWIHNITGFELCCDVGDTNGENIFKVKQFSDILSAGSDGPGVWIHMKEKWRASRVPFGANVLFHRTGGSNRTGGKA